ncbi:MULTISPECIES: NUDIX hydrolase [Mycolicibacterium]|uniref:NUDIX hydrolase n=2 Tax=Mycolicibacterium TaxID=1866885 RepID=A0A378W2D1_9MYCO|nr:MULTISPECIES: NUDIX domain-containing protein [Mycolicibacterium]KLI07674.1 NUDIX hydrolase [Mycolicibacterium senegalense]KLO51502.1 NUDIX hydrolase [Mycolicibacterium senegalense]KMV18500.1 NUDIX hydrolase [Mycolicibacterium conceptionense]MCV7336710.1 NUDIX domain-containing protein [Mycolicibacterium senegalense]MDR7291598.1 8-oxo-dGTP pyrophosphatase MutT (NUDIX family) [Mycolicibacterium senegalense]
MSAESLHTSAVELLTHWDTTDPGQDTLRHAVLSFLAARPDACLRACVPGHITGSALVVDHTGTQTLLTLHPRFGRWLQLGGHCEETDLDIGAAALREATEESGISGLTIDPHLAALHVHPVTCSLGVPTRHLDMQFVVRAPADAEIACSDESLDLRWWPLDALPEGTDFGLQQLADAARRRA